MRLCSHGALSPGHMQQCRTALRQSEAATTFMRWERLPCNEIWLSSAAMIKTTLSAFVAAAFLIASPVFASGKAACCVKNASNSKMACSGGYAGINLTADQKSKLDAAFLKRAKGILSADQYAKVKAQCSQMGKKQA
jgi:hypothetical protein